MFWLYLAKIISKSIEGYFIVGHASLMIFLSFFLTRRLRETFGKPGTPCSYIFGLGYFTWGLSDLVWAINYFIIDNSSRTQLGILITILCGGSFTMLAVSTLAMTKDPLRKFLLSKPLGVAIFISTAIYLSLLMIPFWSNEKDHIMSYFGISESFAISSSLFLLITAFCVLLSSRSLEWSVYGAGMVCWILGDSAIRIGKIVDDSIDFDLFSVLCSFGIYTSLLSLFSKNLKEKIDTVDFSSLFTSYKFGTLLIILSCLCIFSSSGGLDLSSLKLIVLCFSFSTFAAVFMGSFLLKKVTSISVAFSTSFHESMAQNLIQPHVTETQLPLELREYYNIFLSNLNREQNLRNQQRDLEVKQSTLRKVAHNILSPLAALNSQMSAFKTQSEDALIIAKTAIRDINDIANSLSLNYASTNTLSDSIKAELIFSLIDSVVSQKRLEHKKRSKIQIEFDYPPDSYRLFSKLNRIEFRSIISNLINNSVEAIENSGLIRVQLKKSGDNAMIEILDNGKGIPKKYLNIVGTENASFAKKNGSGFGLFHAKKHVETWFGKLNIQSAVGTGTKVVITLPLTVKPTWFAASINVLKNSKVVVLDDSPSMHQVWESRLVDINRSSFKKCELIHFLTASDFKKWILTTDLNEDYTFLLDYDLSDSKETGLDIISQFGLEDKSILVTSYFDDPEIVSRSESNGIKILPKSAASLIPIKFEELAHPKFYSTSLLSDKVILIDNDPLIIRAWLRSAKDKGIPLKTFYSVQEFIQNCAHFAKNCRIYIDSNLDESKKGELESKRLFDEFGYTNIVLTTGYSELSIEKFPWLTSITGKEPPWL